MLHELPIRNVRLSPCHEDWQQMTPTERGRHCRSCDREVVDFTQATLPELLWARAGTPDGQLCGRFRADQLAADQRAATPPPPRLRPKLRWFLAAAALVLLQGLSAQQAAAQVRRPGAPVVHKAAAQHRPPPRRPRRKVVYPPVPEEPMEQVELSERVLGGMMPLEYGPELYPGLLLEPVLQLVRANLLYPTTGRSTARVLVRFTVDATGHVQAPQIDRSAGPAFDTEALRVVRALPQLPPPQTPSREATVALWVFFAADQPPAMPLAEALPDAAFEGRPLYTYTDSMPLYRDGGSQGLQQAIARQARRPPGLADVSGRVLVRFVVDRDGQVRNPEVAQGLHPDFDQAALRVVHSLGAWVPGLRQGLPVDVAYTVAVPFLDN